MEKKRGAYTLSEESAARPTEEKAQSVSVDARTENFIWKMYAFSPLRSDFRVCSSSQDVKTSVKKWLRAGIYFAREECYAARRA